MSEKLLREALKAFDDGLGHLGRDILGTLIERAEQVQPAPSPQPAVPVVGDEQIVAALESAGVKFQRFMGGISGTRNCWSTAGSQDVRKLADGVRAILALRPAVEPMTREQMIAAVRPLCSVEAHAEKLVDLSMDEYRAIEAHHGITAKAEGGA